MINFERHSKEQRAQSKYWRRHAPRVADRFPITDGWRKIRDYCGSRLGNDLFFAPFLVEALVYAYQLDLTGVRLRRNIVHDLLPSLQFDDDGLLIGPSKNFKLLKDGILAGTYIINYQRNVPGVGKTGGFVEKLLNAARIHQTEHLGIAIDMDILLDRSLYQETITKAYVRGPKGISEQMLKQADFPQDKSGTVTEHRRHREDPLLDFLCPLERLEVMWSCRDGFKTVQMEEIRPAPKDLAIHGVVVNRYVHARWDIAQERFTHLDGALRTYNLETYENRLKNDLRKFKGKAEKYKKLFRIDAAMDARTWSDLVANFFDGNELALEYLGG